MAPASNRSPRDTPLSAPVEAALEAACGAYCALQLVTALLDEGLPMIHVARASESVRGAILELRAARGRRQSILTRGFVTEAQP